MRHDDLRFITPSPHRADRYAAARMGAALKQYKLAAWPDLGAPFHGMAYRRMLHQMSQRHVSVRQLTRYSGLERSAVRLFIDMLLQRQLVTEREHLERWAWAASARRALSAALRA